MPSTNRLRILFYILWISTLAIQCLLIGLSGDEAYYWRYSRELSWGYFDHPPLTAVLVKAGYFLFHNELGVRLFFIAAVTGMVLALEKLVKPADIKLFYAIVLSIAFLQVGMVWGGGMMAIPDFPLLLFEVIFFLLYRKYVESPTWHVYLLMPIVVSLMLLTKYHGILVVGFTVISNPRLMSRGSFWTIVALSALLLLPHVSWQVTHDFPSMRYHLFERSSNPYSITYTAEYLGSQLFVLGPIMGILLIYTAIVFKPLNDFERSLKFVAAGTYLFFLFMTFKGRVEANWTIITLIPMVYMGYKHIETTSKLRTLTTYGFAASICLIILFRVVISAHLPVPGLNKFSESLVPWTWCKELKSMTGGKTAVFTNSYQKPALYEFYTGTPSFALNNLWGRKNQYNIWDTEGEFQGKDVVLVANWDISNLDTIRIAGEYFPYIFINNFRSSSNLHISSDVTGPVTAAPASSITANIGFDYFNNKRRDLEANPEYPTNLTLAFFQGTKSKEVTHTEIRITNDMVDGGKILPVTIPAPAATGTYSLYISASTGWLPAEINSRPVTVIVE